MSREWEIDCRLGELTGQLVRGVISDQERAEMHDLQRERVARMMPKWHSDRCPWCRRSA